MMTPSRINKSVWAAIAVSAALCAPSHATLVPSASANISLADRNNGTWFEQGGDGYRSATLAMSGQYNSAEASASLADGALHAKAYSGAQTDPRCVKFWIGCNDKLSARADAGFSDTITFNASSLANPGEVKFRFAITGSLGDRVAKKYAPWSAASFTYTFVTPDKQEHYYSVNTNNGDVFAGSFIVPAGVTEYKLDLSALLAVEATNGGWADFSHTARFQWELPAGITYTSASGAFMADHPPVTSVPEPASAALLSVGLDAAVWTRRRLSGRPLKTKG